MKTNLPENIEARVKETVDGFQSDVFSKILYSWKIEDTYYVSAKAKNRNIYFIRLWGEHGSYSIDAINQ